jgi:hypothetical protein
MHPGFCFYISEGTKLKNDFTKKISVPIRRLTGKYISPAPVINKLQPALGKTF